MPAVSQAQREYLNARFGHAWVVKHGFDNTGRLPEHVGKKRRPGGTANTQLTKMLAARHK
jgi:hypothetical protein